MTIREVFVVYGRFFFVLLYCRASGKNRRDTENFRFSINQRFPKFMYRLENSGIISVSADNCAIEIYCSIKY